MKLYLLFSNKTSIHQLQTFYEISQFLKSLDIVLHETVKPTLFTNLQCIIQEPGKMFWHMSVKEMLKYLFCFNYLTGFLSNNFTFCLDINGHAADVTTLDCHHDNIVALSGSVDGTAKLLSSNTGKVRRQKLVYFVNQQISFDFNFLLSNKQKICNV